MHLPFCCSFFPISLTNIFKTYYPTWKNKSLLMTSGLWEFLRPCITSTHTFKVPSRGPGYQPYVPDFPLSLSLSSRFKYLNFLQARFEYPYEQRGESQNMTISGKVCDPDSAGEVETRNMFYLVHKNQSRRVSKQYELETVHLALCYFLSLLHKCNRHWKAQSSMFPFYCYLN